MPWTSEVCSITAVLATGIVRGAGGSHRRRIYWPFIIRDSYRTSLSRLNRLREVGRRRRRDGLGRDVGLILVKIIKSALVNLLSNDIHVIRDIEFLECLNSESWKEAYRHCQQSLQPEGELPVDLRCGLVKPLRAFECGVNSGPGPDQQNANPHEQHHEPVPSVSVEQDIEINHGNGGRRHVNAETWPVADIEPAGRDKIGRTVHKICHVKTNY